MKTMKDDIQSVLYTEEQLREGVKRIAAEINRDYAGKEIYAIGILKGAIIFYADLVREINVPVSFDLWQHLAMVKVLLVAVQLKS